MSVRPSINHWDWIYATRGLGAVGWYEPDPITSQSLVADAIERGARSIIDVGGGGSLLADHLIETELDRIVVLDISEAGMAVARHRLGRRADAIDWVVGDVTKLRTVGHFDIWHDRALFHFLLDPPSRDRYVRLAERTVPVGGTAIVATFAEDGPERCSGMPVRRYDAALLADEFGPAFRLMDTLRHEHRTPAGVAQMFLYSRFARVATTAGSDRRSIPT